jgi:tRNA (guanine37-N1)-methyltransferase
MRIHIITIFPEYFTTPLLVGILRIAQEKKLLEVFSVNLRDFTDDAYRTVDDYPFGGGPGMILKPEPIFKAVESVKTSNSYVILLSPKGRLFNQKCAWELRTKEHIILICGRYKDVDERVRKYLIDDEISIGDYILSGGEAAALVLIEAVVRLIDGVVGDRESVLTDSFMQGMLDAPYYTRPQDFRGYKVPEVLLSGDHKKIKEWRNSEALRLTKEKRPDLYENLIKNKKEADNG